MMILTKDATDKNKSLKTQLTISSKSREEKISSERVWPNEGFFKDTKLELNLEKKIFRKIHYFISTSCTFQLSKMVI